MKMSPDLEAACLRLADRVDGRQVAASVPYQDQAKVRKAPTGPSETEFTEQVIQLANLCGFLVAHFRPALTRDGQWVTAGSGDAKGFPDLVMAGGHPARVIVAELKVGRRKPTDEQTLWLDAFRRSGVEAYLWTPARWGEIETTLRGPTPLPE